MLLKNNLVKLICQYFGKFKCMGTMSAESDLREIFAASVKSVQPEILIESAVTVNNNVLEICGVEYTLQKPCHVVGFGKAVLGMALRLESILGTNLAGGVINIPAGILATFPHKMSLVQQSKLKFIEGAPTNLPDQAAMEGAQKIKALASSLKQNDLLIVLISGGGSALLPLPKPPVTLSQKCQLTTLLQSRGANITELNCVRKRLSQLKGGGLAVTAFPAQVVTLIVSDVIGDPLDFIASGPTAPNTDAPDAAGMIIEKYGLMNDIPKEVQDLLFESKPVSADPFQLNTIERNSNGGFEHVRNLVIGNNHIAAEAALTTADDLGYSSALLSLSIAEEVSCVSKSYSVLAKEHCSRMLDSSSENFHMHFSQSALAVARYESLHGLNISQAEWNNIGSLDYENPKGICLILAGEPTVQVTGQGKGGRNTHLALNFAIDLYRMDVTPNKGYEVEVYFMSAGTDGIDGPTDAAGAIVSNYMVHDALKRDLDPLEYLLNNDSYNFFAAYDSERNLIRTGHTGTNVMDIHVIILRKRIRHSLSKL